VEAVRRKWHGGFFNPAKENGKRIGAGEYRSNSIVASNHSSNLASVGRSSKSLCVTFPCVFCKPGVK
jgi:hypothetical protein